MKSDRLDYVAINADAITALTATKKHITTIDKKLQALIELRVSQINGCAYCVDLHSRQARASGESQQRLDCLVAWEESPFFTPDERAALAWAEAVTLISETNAPDAVYDALSAHFSDQQIVDLTLITSLMNALNRLAISFRHVPEKRT